MAFDVSGLQGQKQPSSQKKQAILAGGYNDAAIIEDKEHPEDIAIV